MSLTKLPPHAMINSDGDLFYPDDLADALHFQSAHGAWPVLPQRFPWTAEVTDAFLTEFCGP